MDLQSLVSSAQKTRDETLENALLFAKSKERHLVELMTIGADATQHPRSFSFRDSTQLSTHLANDTDESSSGPSLDVYSICQRDTWAPLNVSQEMIIRLADHFCISSGFYQLLRCFRDRSVGTEEGFAGAARSVHTRDKSEFGWIYKYSEKKDVKSGNPWRIRHTGIYHVLDRKRAKTIVIIISPSPAAYFITHIKSILQDPSARALMLASPMSLHSMLITSHLSSWQGYLEHHEAMLLRLDMKPACYSLDQTIVTYDILKEVREVEKKILPIDPLLAALESLVDDVQEANGNFNNDDGLCTEISTILTESRKEISSYRTQASYLHKRAQSTAQSVLDSLNLGFQQLAQSQSKNTYVMARSARDDSVAIRAITLVTSFYLPFSFVATMFGMNLVEFDSDSRNLVVSHQFWLYFLVSVPLTAVTLAFWRYSAQRYRKSYLKEAEHVKYDNTDVEKGRFDSSTQRAVALHTP